MRNHPFTLGELFDLVPGAFHAKAELEAGRVPLVSCGWEGNGVIGYFDIPSEFTHERTVTVAFNGTPLTANFHPYRFGAKDDVAVLVPKQSMPEAVLLHVAALLNASRWRYSYGRKCYREKLARVSVDLPVDLRGKIDSERCSALFETAVGRLNAATATSISELLRTSNARL